MPKRNWPSILIDAGLRGLNCLDVAREQGCDRSSVAQAAQRYAVRLAHSGQHSGGRGGPRRPDKARAMEERKRAKYAALLASGSKGETINGFCRRAGVSIDTAARWAGKLGHTFGRAASTITVHGRPSRALTHD